MLSLSKNTSIKEFKLPENKISNSSADWTIHNKREQVIRGCIYFEEKYNTHDLENYEMVLKILYLGLLEYAGYKDIT